MEFSAGGIQPQHIQMNFKTNFGKINFSTLKLRLDCVWICVWDASEPRLKFASQTQRKIAFALRPASEMSDARAFEIFFSNACAA